MAVLDSFSLKNKVALVTGGVGLYGRQIVTALAEAGAKTYIASRSIDKLREVADEYQTNGYDVEALQVDLAEEPSILALRDEVEKRNGCLDVLVNNAVLRSMTNGYDDEVSTFAESMQVNATGLFTITRAFGDLMSKKNSGSIINIGSIQGMIGPDPAIYEGTGMHGFYPDYFFHKGGMINFTRFTASYYGSKSIRCNCISPGGLWTPSMDATFEKQYSARTFLGRPANSTDLMGVIVFLASDASVYVTGTNIPIDGGYTAK